jgi:hypothetical protein
VSPSALRGLGLLSGMLFLVMMLTFVGRPEEFLGPSGWLDDKAYREIDKLEGDNTDALLRMFNAERERHKLPPLTSLPRQRLFPFEQGWSIFFLAGDDTPLLHILYWAGIGVVALFALGIATRITSVLTYVWVVSYTANPIISYEGDFLCVILALYMMIGHMLWGFWNGNLTVVEMILGPRPLGVFQTLGGGESAPPSVAANFAVRLFQIHFALIVFMAALHKLHIGDWWSGSAYWYLLHPPMSTTREAVMEMQPHGAFYLGMLGLLQYIGLAWQLAFPFFAWRSEGFWRGLLLVGACIHLAACWVFAQPLFGEFYLIGCLSYLPPAVWSQGARMMGASSVSESAMSSRADKVAVGS